MAESNIDPNPGFTNQDDADRSVSWKNRIAMSRRMRDDRSEIWKQNVEKLKAGKGAESTEQGVSINKDWPLTKAKKALLYSQDPEVRLTPKSDAFGPIVQQFARLLNETYKDVNVGATINEELSDVINASGISGALIYYESKTEVRDMPVMDPMLAGPIFGTPGQQVPTMPVEVVVDAQHCVDRVASTDLLISTNFTGSDYDKGPWIGREGRMTWPQAQSAFGLDEGLREKVVGADKRSSNVHTTLNTDSNKFRDTEVVNFQEVFYWRHLFHPEETRFKAIQRIVFVDGLEEPVIDEEYRGQKRMPDGSIVGVTRFPIQILTLTYVSDEALPPSDSTISRAQVDELESIHDLMKQQRKHSIPVRWFNPNVVSPNTRDKLEKGTVQGFVPVANGERGIGEIARASFPPENFEFERSADASLSEIYQVGTNQAGAFAKGERSASEANIIQQNFQTRVGQERDLVAKHATRIAEVLAGHLALFGQFELPAGIPREAVANGFLYDIRPDSTVRQDAKARKQEILDTLNMTAQSGFVNPKKPISEIWELSGFDPAEVVIDPQPKDPDPVNVSAKGEDLVNPMMLALLARTKQLPTPEDLAAAIKVLEAVMAVPGGAALMAPPVEPSADGRPPREPETPGITNSNWEAAPRVERRDADGGA